MQGPEVLRGEDTLMHACIRTFKRTHTHTHTQRSIVHILGCYFDVFFSPDCYLPATNPIIHSARLLSPTAEVTLPFENTAIDLTWPRN